MKQFFLLVALCLQFFAHGQQHKSFLYSIQGDWEGIQVDNIIYDTTGTPLLVITNNRIIDASQNIYGYARDTVFYGIDGYILVQKKPAEIVGIDKIPALQPVPEALLKAVPLAKNYYTPLFLDEYFAVLKRDAAIADSTQLKYESTRLKLKLTETLSQIEDLSDRIEDLSDEISKSPFYNGPDKLSQQESKFQRRVQRQERVDELNKARNDAFSENNQYAYRLKGNQDAYGETKNTPPNLANALIRAQYLKYVYQKRLFDSAYYCYAEQAYNPAMQWCYVLLKQIPYHVNALYLQASAFIQLGMLDAALSNINTLLDLEETVDIAEAKGDIYAMKAELLYLKGDTKSAAKCIVKAMENDSKRVIEVQKRYPSLLQQPD